MKDVIDVLESILKHKTLLPIVGGQIHSTWTQIDPGLPQ